MSKVVCMVDSTNDPTIRTALRRLLENLNGYDAPIKYDKRSRLSISDSICSSGISYSQFNELQLTFGFNRVTTAFFQYLVDNSTEFDPETKICSIDNLEEGVTRFRTDALVLFGNVRHAFERFSTDEEDLEFWLAMLKPMDEEEFINRHDPIYPIDYISGNDTYYLGHLVQESIKEKYNLNPESEDNKREYDLSMEVAEKGKKNFESYLASDHLDVYIATSMREREEYFLINKWVKEIFENPILNSLNLRWFDPTQAFCDNRIDKGLFEGLMLRRALCTVYFIQESDTLGKDSELASTLAQGKAVIAFVPTGDEEYVNLLLGNLKDLYPEKTEKEIILTKLKEFDPKLAWEDKEVIRWVSAPDEFSVSEALRKLKTTIKKAYDERASLLSKKHPLGVQVNLATGVANGVLVVRDLNSCAKIIRNVILKRLEFDIEEKTENSHKYIYLKEKESGCIYRLATGEKMLSNSFWNYYPSSL